MAPSNPLLRFFTELRRRRVFRVAAAYAVGGWVAIEVTSVLAPELMLPGWLTRAVIVVVLAGFPVALVLAWAFDLTPDGVRRAAEDSLASPPAPSPDFRDPGPPERRRIRMAAVGALAVVMAGTGWIVVSGRARETARAEALARLAEIEALVDEERWGEAYDGAVDVREVLPDHPALDSIWPMVSDRLTLTSDPPGAQVWARRIDRPAADSVLLGTTPITDLRVPRVDHHLRIVLAGHAPAERIASGRFARSQSYGEADRVEMAVSLVPIEELPEGMVAVPGGSYRMISQDLPSGLQAGLDDFFIDRYEVSNARFRTFVTGGGYTRPALWPSPLVVGGDTLAFEQAIGLFVDRSGLPGPRGWASQVPPAGTENLPVTGVSWYEASAYCAFLEASLPSVFQWEKAARDGRLALVEGMIMPWGYVAPAARPEGRANLAGQGPAPVGSYPFGISPFGAHDMAGNVKEWTANPIGEGRAVTGASWEDPTYLFTEFGAWNPAASAPSLGFRCARVRATDARRSRDQGTFALPLDQRTPEYQPVDRRGFESLLAHYRYDRRPAGAEITERIETDEWVRETLTYAGPEGRVLAYLFLPKSSAPPHQTVLYVPGGDSFRGTPVGFHAEHWMSGLVRSGRALFAPVLFGMTERPFPDDFVPPEPSSVRFRDLMVRHATEIRLGLDYLATRDDIDMESLAYAGISFGAGSRLAFAAVDDRYAAVVLIGGGIDERIKPTLPEADNVNFAPYIEAPTLLLNGRQDEEHPWLTRALPLWNLLSEPKELELFEGVGHVPPPELLIPAINGFLNRHLGPVR